MLLVTNTLAGRKEEFVPISADQVGLYSCGPTVYDYAHIGNFRAYVFVDILKRTLILLGYNVKHVMNITDVGHLSGDSEQGEEKMEKGARREGKTVWEIAAFYAEVFFHDTDALNIIRPDVVCKATEHIQDMIEMIKTLEGHGFTYTAGGNVYFKTSAFPAYGKMARLNLSQSATQSRIEQDPYKESLFDFVLWFTRHKYTNPAMEWDSPWGRGFPGWHIECSAMASKYLGEHFDIHTGGIDHIPVHHTNEIAQSEAAFGHKWVNYWLHNAFLVIGDNAKMGKSEGNLLTLQTLVDQGYTPIDYRYMLLGAVYRNSVVFSDNAMKTAKNSMARLRRLLAQLNEDKNPGDVQTTEFTKLQQEFINAISDDLNTPLVLALLWKTLDSNNLNTTTKLTLIGEYDKALGLGLTETVNKTIPADIIALAEERKAAKKRKDWARADVLRVQLQQQGYDVSDTKDGFRLQKK